MIPYPFPGMYMRCFEVLEALAVTKDHHIASEEACSVALAAAKPSRKLDSDLFPWYCNGSHGFGQCIHALY